jgi:hypothetical protein
VLNAPAVSFTRCLERGYHVLIGYTSGNKAESDQRALAGILDMVQRRLDGSVASLSIVAPDADFVDCELLPLFVDHDGSFQQVYAASSGMVWLVQRYIDFLVVRMRLSVSA